MLGFSIAAFSLASFALGEFAVEDVNEAEVDDISKEDDEMLPVVPLDTFLAQADEDIEGTDLLQLEAEDQIV